MWRECATALGFCAISLSAVAGEPARGCSFASGAERLPVLELYTSEGCSSCPPADQWLSRTFVTGGDLAERVLPLAFHVDYWNSLGWPDRFSKPAFTARQQKVATRARANAVYTPQFVFDGRDVHPHGFARDILDRAVPATRTRPLARIEGALTVSPDVRIGVTGSVRLEPSVRSAQVWVALFQQDLRTRVNAGENAGRWLRHDFVVREWTGPFSADATGRIDLGAEWAWPAELREAAAGVAIVAENAATGETLQAVASTLCRP